MVRGGIALTAFYPLMLCLAIIAYLPTTLSAAIFTESFSSNPNVNGWQIFGDTNLFRWDSTNQNLRVTWNSSQSNSYFHRPLGTILTRDEDFALSFEVMLEDFAIGTTPGKPGTFEIAIGLLNLDQATGTNFFRGAGVNALYGPRNLVEFNFFPAFDTFQPTISQVIISTNSAWLYHNNLIGMTAGEIYQVRMDYVAASRTLTTIVSNNAAQYGETQFIVVPDNFDFRVATLSISSYSDAIQPPPAGSILAHGTVDNFAVVTPPPPVSNLSGNFTNAQWHVQFTSRTNWQYTLERSADFIGWNALGEAVAGNGSVLQLIDPNPQSANAFYRVRANRP